MSSSWRDCPMSSSWRDCPMSSSAVFRRSGANCSKLKTSLVSVT